MIFITFNVIFLISTFTRVINEELFTSSLKLCELLKNELDSLIFLENKIYETGEYGELYELLNEIRLYLPKNYFDQTTYPLDDCLDENSKINRFVTNPINTYMLIKRFVSNWKSVKECAKNHTITDISGFKNYFELYQKDLAGAYQALYRLQDFYSLDIKDLKDGTLSHDWKLLTRNWTIVPKHLSAEDMYNIGKVAFERMDYKSVKIWMEGANFEIKNQIQNQYNYLIYDILDYLSWAEYTLKLFRYEMGEYEMAFMHCTEMVKHDPENKRWVGNLKLFNESRSVQKSNPKPKDRSCDIESALGMREKLASYSLDTIYREEETILSKVVCKEGKIWKSNKVNELKPTCFVKRGSNKYGKFIMSNIEKISSEPEAYLLRSIVDDRDILHFKKLGRSQLKTALISNPLTGIQETAEYRITMSSWFGIKSDPVIKKMASKVIVATGLTLESSEDLQIANYGIGGYYDTHYDFATKTDASKNHTRTLLDGDRLATYLLYMSDVPIGGKTAFHRIGLSVQPSKGDALLWYNLFSDGTGDARTRHIACPVALGTKWIGTFWIRERGEEVSRPCGLKETNGI